MGGYRNPSEPIAFAQRDDMEPGMIAMWSGAIGAIPAGYALCDGTLGTPDLRNQFIFGASVILPPGPGAGAATHAHTFTAAPHAHSVAPNGQWQDGDGPGLAIQNTQSGGATDVGSTMPPYYYLAFIMKL